MIDNVFFFLCGVVVGGLITFLAIKWTIAQMIERGDITLNYKRP